MQQGTSRLQERNHRLPIVPHLPENYPTRDGPSPMEGVSVKSEHQQEAPETHWDVVRAREALQRFHSHGQAEFVTKCGGPAHEPWFTTKYTVSLLDKRCSPTNQARTFCTDGEARTKKLAEGSALVRMAQILETEGLLKSNKRMLSQSSSREAALRQRHSSAHELVEEKWNLARGALEKRAWSSTHPDARDIPDVLKPFCNGVAKAILSEHFIASQMSNSIEVEPVGPPQQRVFFARVEATQGQYVYGKGLSKKEAEAWCAKAAVNFLEEKSLLVCRGYNRGAIPRRTNLVDIPPSSNDSANAWERYKFDLPAPWLAELNRLANSPDVTERSKGLTREWTAENAKVSLYRFFQIRESQPIFVTTAPSRLSKAKSTVEIPFLRKGSLAGVGTGSSKKEAEHAAAIQACVHLDRLSLIDANKFTKPTFMGQTATGACHVNNHKITKSTKAKNTQPPEEWPVVSASLLGSVPKVASKPCLELQDAFHILREVFVRYGDDLDSMMNRFQFNKKYHTRIMLPIETVFGPSFQIERSASDPEEADAEAYNLAITVLEHFGVNIGRGLPQNTSTPMQM